MHSRLFLAFGRRAHLRLHWKDDVDGGGELDRPLEHRPPEHGPLEHGPLEHGPPPTANLWFALAVLCLAPQLACDGDPFTATPPVIDDLDVEIVGACQMVARVTWTTDLPSTSRVEFGEDGSVARFVEDGSMVTEHDLLVVGLPADTEITFEVVSASNETAVTRAGPEIARTGEFVNRELVTEVTVLDADRVRPGWTLANLLVADSSQPTVAVLFDATGRPVWFHEMGPDDGSADVEVTQVVIDRFLIGGGVAGGYRPVEVDWLGEVHWEGPEQPEGLAAKGSMHHTFQKMDDGHYLTLEFDYVDGYLADQIVELDEQGTQIWSWASYYYLEPLGSEEFHGNMALVDADADAAYFNCKDSRLYRLDRETKDLDWVLGEGGDFDFVGDHDYPWFERPHGLDLTSDSTVLMYDNGTERRSSRAVEYAWDEDDRTAEIIWEYDGGTSGSWVTTAWGDTDRLDNGNTLIVAGSMLTDDTPSQMMEVTADGELVWQMNLSTTTGDLAGSYMAQRIPAPSQAIE